jgi:hypothetical protein
MKLLPRCKKEKSRSEADSYQQNTYLLRLPSGEPLSKRDFWDLDRFAINSQSTDPHLEFLFHFGRQNVEKEIKAVIFLTEFRFSNRRRSLAIGWITP